MKRTRTQIKAEMMKRFEEEIDELLNWREGSEPPTLSQMEEELLKRRKEISQAMIEGLLSDEENQGPVKAPECHMAMENKGKREKVVETRLDTLCMEGEYYVCPRWGVLQNSPAARFSQYFPQKNRRPLDFWLKNGYPDGKQEERTGWMTGSGVFTGHANEKWGWIHYLARNASYVRHFSSRSMKKVHQNGFETAWIEFCNTLHCREGFFPSG